MNTDRNAQLSMGFSCIGHSFSHLFAPIFYVAALALEGELGLSHGETVSLIVVGNLLFGFAAPLAGWFGDRWSSVGMMGIFFVGTGAEMVMVGVSNSPFAIGLWLSATGLFASIYHPVGIAWLVRISVNTGTVLGINGAFSAFGPALAALMTGALIDLVSWRAAFTVPGTLVLMTGLSFYGFIAFGWIFETKGDRKPPPKSATRSDTIRVIGVLAFTMVCSGVIYRATQPALPKAFALDFGTAEGSGIFGVLALVAMVYAVSGLMQAVGGRMADIYPVRQVYLFCYLMQIPFLLLAGMVAGSPLVAVAIVMVCLNSSALPAENLLIARYTPPHRRALVYGLKFVLAIGVASLGVLLEGRIFDATGGFMWLFIVLAAFALAASSAIFGLPVDRDEHILATASAAEQKA